VQSSQRIGRIVEITRNPKVNLALITFKKRVFNTLFRILHYVILISISFIFIYPMLYLISKSMMQSYDLADATVQWVPKRVSFANYDFAYTNLIYLKSFFNSVMTSLVPALIQIISCAIVGYGFARYNFPGKGIWLALVVFTFLVPPQTLVVPLYIFFSDLGWINTFMPFMVPAAFGHGLRGALFVLIFIQFFRGLPFQLEEAARIDGAGAFRTFWAIMFPLARPAMLVVFLFSLVWHWNDVFQPSLYVFQNSQFNLTQQLTIMNGQGEAELIMGTGTGSVGALAQIPTYVNRVMAGALLTILPMLILYLFTQRYFVESAERAGIAGE
jgi:multiple sugar transport system permease protein